MFWITEEARLVCNHRLGKVQNRPTQDLVTVHERRVLVDADPEGCPIAGCPNINVGIVPCVTTRRVDRGYSEWIHIDGRRVCLDTVSGFTDGSPPGVANYFVDAPGQEWIDQR